jgi:hypothetical protein
LTLTPHPRIFTPSTGFALTASRELEASINKVAETRLDIKVIVVLED